jgi:hypothetical protein
MYVGIPELSAKKQVLHIKTGKIYSMTCRCRERGEVEYISKLITTLALEGLGGQHHTPDGLPARNTRYPLYQRLGGPQGQSARAQANLSPLGFKPQSVWLVANHYTGYTSLTTIAYEYQYKCYISLITF